MNHIFQVQIQQTGGELQIKNCLFVNIDMIIIFHQQDELARYRGLVNQLQREKKELLSGGNYPAAIRKPNSV